MPPSIPPAKGSDPEDVVWALQTADALWRRAERADALVWLRRAIQAAGEADDPERAFALADAAAELSSQVDDEITGTAVRVSLAPDASGSIDIPVELDARNSFPPAAGEEIDDLLGDGTDPAPPGSEAHPVSVPGAAPIPAAASSGRLPPPALPPPRSPERPPSGAAFDQPPSSESSGARSVPLPRGAIFEDSTPFLPRDDSDEHVAASREALAQGFDSLVRRPTGQRPPPLPARPQPPPLPTRPPSVGESAEPELDTRGRQGAPTTPPPPPDAPGSVDPTGTPQAPRVSDPAEPPQAERAGETAEPPRATADPPAQSAEPPLTLDAEAFADLPDETRERFASVAIHAELAKDEDVPASALCYVLEGEVRVSSAVAEAAGLVLRAGDVLRARGTVNANLPLRLTAHSERARVVTWAGPDVDAAFASCPWVEDDLRGSANRTLAICGATIGPLGERLDESIFLEVMSGFEVKVLLADEELAAAGSPLPGLCIVGVGEIVGEENLGPGDFVFPQGVLSPVRVPSTFRAGPDGALVLFASRSQAQELLVTCPPLLEMLAGM